MLNAGIVTLSIFAMTSSTVFEALAFRPMTITNTSAELGLGIPQLWTLFTCTFFESSLFFMCLHLLMLNYLVN